MTGIEKAELTLEGLVHDLNNVFQTIGESAELLRGDPKWVKLAGTLQRSVDHGQRLVHSILEKKRCSAEAAAVVESAVQFAQDYLECVHGPRIEISPQVEQGTRLVGDPAGWERVLVNLFLNAAEAGAKHVEVSVTPEGMVVRDDGPGIAPDLLPHIF